MTTAIRTLAGERRALRELALLALFAVGLVLARGALRGIHVPGHAELPTLFFLILGRLSVPRLAAASGLGVAAGGLGTLSGVLGPGGAATLLLAAATVDVACARLRPWPPGGWTLAGIGALAGAMRLLPAVGFAGTGLATGALLLHGLTVAAPHAAFGAAGAVLAARLQERVRGREQA